MALRLATVETKRIDIEDDDWIEVVQDVSKRDFNLLIGKMPADLTEEGMTPAQGTKFYEALFEIFVKGWSLEGTPATLENYLALDRESAEKIDLALTTHFNEMTVEPPKEKKPKTSRA